MIQVGRFVSRWVKAPSASIDDAMDMSGRGNSSQFRRFDRGPTDRKELSDGLLRVEKEWRNNPLGDCLGGWSFLFVEKLVYIFFTWRRCVVRRAKAESKKHGEFGRVGRDPAATAGILMVIEGDGWVVGCAIDGVDCRSG